MSLLLALQGVAEETSNVVIVAQDDSVPAVFTSSEDFPGVAGLDEVGVGAAVVVDSVLVSAAVQEDFAGFLPLEEVSAQQWTIAHEPTWIGVNSEDFAGSLPLEETSAWQWVPVAADVVWTIAVNEEFGGAHPTEETSTWQNILVDEFVWQIGSSEDFAGSLPVDEQATWQWITLETDIVRNAVASEEFGSAHPTEEISTWQSVIVDDSIAAFTTSEELFVSFPVDEQSAWQWTADAELSWITVVSEEFAVPTIAFDEQPTVQWIIDVDAIVTASTSSEDIVVPVVATLVDESTGYLPAIIEQPYLSVFQYNEDIVGPFVPPPPPPAPIVVRPPVVVGGNGGIWYQPYCRPDSIEKVGKKVGKQKKKSIQKKIDKLIGKQRKNTGAVKNVDYGILPISGAEIRAIIDGEITYYVDEKAGLVAKLVAADGTTYIYAKVAEAVGEINKTYRVLKDDVIGFMAAEQTERLLGAGVVGSGTEGNGVEGSVDTSVDSTNDHQLDSAAPPKLLNPMSTYAPAVYGVFPVPRIEKLPEPPPVVRIEVLKPLPVPVPQPAPIVPQRDYTNLVILSGAVLGTVLFIAIVLEQGRSMAVPKRLKGAQSPKALKAPKTRKRK